MSVCIGDGAVGCRELSGLVDRSWHMHMGGKLEEVAWKAPEKETNLLKRRSRKGRRGGNVPVVV